MPRTKITNEVRKFWEGLKELLKEQFEKVKEFIVVKARGGCSIIVHIGAQAVRMLGLGTRRRRFQGRAQRVLGEIARAYSA